MPATPTTGAAMIARHAMQPSAPELRMEPIAQPRTMEAAKWPAISGV